MKLLYKSSLYYLALLIPVLIATGFILFSIIGYEIGKYTDKSLLSQREVVEGRLLKCDSCDVDSFTGADPDVSITLLTHKPGNISRFRDTVLFDRFRKRNVPYRKLNFYVERNGRYLGIEIRHSKVKSDEIVESILESLTITFCLLLLGLISINGIVSRRLWYPFYKSLAQLNRVSFKMKEPPVFDSSSTKEFDELNKTLTKMSRKMFSDYANQKQFTENASHELQTPLAVIKSKTDLLLQSKSTSEEDMMLVADIEHSVSKLTYLNRSLLLLSKLENRQFDEITTIDIKELLLKILANFEDRITLKRISIISEYNSTVILNLNRATAEVLFSNLIQNAIRYNSHENGIIKIILTNSNISICNTGPVLKGDPERIFDRFTKFNTNSESIGLGLSIAKQICEYYNFGITYRYENDFHCFRVTF